MRRVLQSVHRNVTAAPTLPLFSPVAIAADPAKLTKNKDKTMAIERTFSILKPDATAAT